MNTNILDKEAPDLWERTARLQWGQYLLRIETAAVNKATQATSAVGSALDVGAEQGRWTRLLLDAGWKVTSTDICPQKVENCQSRNPTGNSLLVSPDDVRLPVADQSQDLVVSIEVPANADPWFVPEVDRVLKPGGVAVLTLQNRSSYRAWIVNLKSWLKTEQVFYPLSYSSFRKNLTNLGFQVLHQEGFAWLPFSRFSDSALIPWLLPIENTLQLRRLPRISPWVVAVFRKPGPLAENDAANIHTQTPLQKSACAKTSRSSAVARHCD